MVVVEVEVVVEEVNVAARKDHWKDHLVSKAISSGLEHVEDFSILMRNLLDILVNLAVNKCPAVTPIKITGNENCNSYLIMNIVLDTKFTNKTIDFHFFHNHIHSS
jgi:hypothetical protein